jgi:hypothetical protein
LVGPTREEPQLNISCSDAFNYTIDPECPIALRWTLCCFLTLELALADHCLAQEVEDACLLAPERLDAAVQQAPEGKLIKLPKFRDLYAKIVRLEGGQDFESEMALAF